MNPKSFLLLCGGMTLSFGLILAFVLMAVGTKSKRPIHHKSGKGADTNHRKRNTAADNRDQNDDPSPGTPQT